MPLEGKNIVRRYEKLRANRVNFENRWDKLAPFIAPSRYGIVTQFAPGANIMEDVYDSTGQFAADIMAKFIAGEIMNPAEQWAANIHGNKELRKNDEVREWLEEVTEIQHEDLHRSNFYLEAPSSLVDWGGFGTASLFYAETPVLSNVPFQPGYRGTRFQADKIGRFLIDEDPLGRVDTLYRDFFYTARQASDRWGNNVSQAIKEARDAGNEDRQFTFIHAIQPRPNGEKQFGNKGFAWLSAYVEKETKHLVEEGGYERFPSVNPRWDKTPGEIYGRGPGEVALHDILTKNKGKRLELEDWALKVRPPVVVAHDSVIGTLRFKPAGLLTVKTRFNQSVKDVLSPFETGSRHDLNQIEQEQLKQAIRQAFFVDQIMQFLEMDLKDVNNFTFAKKLQLLFKVLGATYGRMQTEFLRPLWETHFMMLFGAGLFPPPPDVLAEFEDGGLIDVEFNNPLARAQKSGDNDAMTLALANLEPVIKLEMELRGYSETFDWIDIDKNAQETLRTSGVPATRIRSESEVKGAREARAEAQKQEQATEEAGMMVEGANKLAPMVKAMQGGKAGQ